MRVRLGEHVGGENGSSRIAIDGESGEEFGLIECSVTDGWLDVRWIELGVEHRRWGLGAEAVRLLEVEAAERGVRRAQANVPVGNGLALYFWLRLGYRPGASAGVEPDVMPMVREIENGERGQKNSEP